ncbi:MAG: AMP-binding protein, partial [Pseudomonadota bacterium]
MLESKAPGIFAFDMDAKAEEKPDFPVLTFENSPYPDEVLTYSDLVRKGRRLARALEESGFGPGDTFNVIMRNHPENPIAMYAASLLQAIMVPIDPRSKGEKLRFQIKNSGSKGVIFSAEFMEEMKVAMSGLPEVKVIGVRYKDAFTGPVDPNFPDIEEMLSGTDVPPYAPKEHNLNDKLMMIYTSGTTGDPKGVHVRNSRLGAFIMIGQHIWKYRPDDKLYNGLSLSHANAYVCTMIPALFLSIPAVISRRFTKSRFWEIIRAHGCTSFTNLGGVMMGLYSEPPRPDDADNPARLCVSAGTPRAIWEAFEKRFKVKIHEWYATVEGGFAHKPPDVGPTGSFGKPLAGLFEMKVVREDDMECDPYEV